MSRGLAISLVLPAVGAVAAAGAVAAPAAPAAPQPTSVRLAECSLESGSASFYARVRRIQDSARMWMRFTLLEKQLNRYVAVRAPGLSRWHRSKPGVAAFGYRQTVRGLQKGGLYRMRVSFRWYGDDGELIERARRRSAPCRQFGALPNLSSQIVRAERTRIPGVMRYRMAVANTGEAPAADVALRLSVDASVVDSVSIASLAPGDRRVVALRGPECTSSVESMADPDGVIVEASEADNGHALSCADLPTP